MSIEIPFEYTEEYDEIWQCIKDTAAVLNLLVVGRTVFDKHVIVKHGLIFKETCYKGVGYVWLFNDARNADYHKKVIVIDFDESLDRMKEFADTLLKTDKFKGFTIRLNSFPVSEDYIISENKIYVEPYGLGMF